MRVNQGSTPTVMLKLFDSSDHISPATGKTVAITISKDGSAFANPNAGATNATEISNGWYSVDLAAADVDTIGDLVVRGTSTGCDDAERLLEVGLAPMNEVVESNFTLASTLRLLSSMLHGKVSGAGTGTEVFRDLNDTKDRVTVTVAANNRTAVTRDPT